MEEREEEGKMVGFWDYRLKRWYYRYIKPLKGIPSRASQRRYEVLEREPFRYESRPVRPVRPIKYPVYNTKYGGKEEAE